MLPGWTFINNYDKTPGGQLAKIQSELLMQEKLGLLPGIYGSCWGFDGGLGIASSAVAVERKSECQRAPSSGSCSAAPAGDGRVEKAAVPSTLTRKAQPRADVQDYATVTGSDQTCATITKNAYIALCQDRESYDFFIDGVARRSFKRASRSETHQEARLTIADLTLFREYVEKGGIQRPCKMRPDAGPCSPMSAISQFNAMRRKIDINRGPRVYTLLHTHKRPLSERRSFEFSPPDGVSWVLIMPHQT